MVEGEAGDVAVLMVDVRPDRADAVGAVDVADVGFARPRKQRVEVFEHGRFALGVRGRCPADGCG